MQKAPIPGQASQTGSFLRSWSYNAITSLGFLGLGSKHVAIAPSAFDVVKGQNDTSDKLKISATKDQLEQAQNFEPYQPARTTTGMGAPSGLGGPVPRPSSNTPPASSR